MGADEVRIDRGGKLDLATFPSSIGDEWGPGYDSSPRPMSIDVLLITSNAVRDEEAYFPLLARRATIVLMTFQQDPVFFGQIGQAPPGRQHRRRHRAWRQRRVSRARSASAATPSSARWATACRRPGSISNPINGILPDSAAAMAEPALPRPTMPTCVCIVRFLLHGEIATIDRQLGAGDV